MGCNCRLDSPSLIRCPFLQAVTAMQLHGPVIIITCIALLKFAVLITCRACGSAEYEIRGECCPMCSAGQRVYKDCSGDFSTTCVPCMQSTYTDVPNGMIKCFPCTVCEEGSGLRIKEKCHTTADTLCEPLPGYYCIETDDKTCIKARPHSACLPGQYINQNGTAFTDTVCKGCSEGTYSDGSFTFCKPHTKCESMGQKTTKLGTNSSDSECTDQRFHYLPLVVVSLLVLVLLVMMICIFYLKTMMKTYNLADA